MLTTQPYLNAAELQLIRQLTLPEAQPNKELHPQLLELIHHKGWLRSALPQALNPQALTALTLAELFEVLAYADASLGWLVNLGAGANMFLGYLPATAAAQLAQNPKLWIAGSGAPTGTARQTDQGYELNGKWKYASGSSYATHFSARAYLHDTANQPLLNQQGEQKDLAFIFTAQQVEILPSWQTQGLQASVSNDFQVQAALVPQNLTFDLSQPSQYGQESLYRYPFMSFAVANLAVMVSGIAQHFGAEFRQQLVNTQSTSNAQSTLNALATPLEQDFLHKRQAFWRQVQELQQLVEQKLITSTAEQNLETAAKAMVDSAYAWVMGLYRHCGMRTVFSSNRLAQLSADFLVATQHLTIRPSL